MEDPAKRREIGSLARAALRAEGEETAEVYLKQILEIFQNPDATPIDASSVYYDGPKDTYSIFILESAVLIGKHPRKNPVLEAVEVYSRDEATWRLQALFRCHEKTVLLKPRYN